VTDFLPKFEEMVQESGRDKDSLPVTVWDTPPDTDTIKRFQDRGVTRVIAELDSESLDTLLPELDRWADVIDRL
jgi:hypothetical protein